jgi:hypothetical protein
MVTSRGGSLPSRSHLQSVGALTPYRSRAPAGQITFVPAVGPRLSLFIAGPHRLTDGRTLDAINFPEYLEKIA